MTLYPGDLYYLENLKFYAQGTLMTQGNKMEQTSEGLAGRNVVHCANQLCPCTLSLWITWPSLSERLIMVTNICCVLTVCEALVKEVCVY